MLSRSKMEVLPFLLAFAIVISIFGSSTPANAERTPASVEYVKEQYGLSAGQATERLRLQGDAVKLNDSLREDLGGDFTALWFDTRLGEIIVGVRSESAATHTEATLVREELGRESKVVTLGYGEAQLYREVTALADRFEPEIGKGWVTLALAQGRIELTFVKDAPARLIEDIQAKTDLPTKVVLSNEDDLRAEPMYCTQSDCDEVVGGVRWWPSESPGAKCTAGFPVSAGWGGQRYVITAGHCVNHATNVGEWPYQFFTWSTCDSGWLHPAGITTCGVSGIVPGEYSYGPEGDYGLLTVGGPATVLPGTMDWNTRVYNQVWGAFEQNPPTGITLCKHGFNSGTTCGTLEGVEATARHFGGVTVGHNLRIENLCTKAGDSGGGVTFDFLGYLVAAGLVSASSSPRPGGCETDRLYATPIHRALQGMGVVYP